MSKRGRETWPRLGYPVRKMAFGGMSLEEYIIPDEDRARVLDELYPFEPVPGLNERMFDLHEEKEFLVREYRVVRGPEIDLLVSPYFPMSGGTVIDWMPADFRPGGRLIRQVRDGSLAIETVSFGPRAKCH